jgi:hypothetical protein
MTLVIVLLSIVYILNIIDYFQTIYAVGLCGIGVEANPIGRFFLENNSAWIMKFIFVPIILTAIGIIVRIDKKQIWAVYLILVMYFALVMHNFIMLSRMGVF